MERRMERELTDAFRHADPEQIRKLMRKHAFEERMQYEDAEPDREMEKRMIRRVLARTVWEEGEKQKMRKSVFASPHFWYGWIAVVCVLVLLAGGTMALQKRWQENPDRIEAEIKPSQSEEMWNMPADSDAVSDGKLTGSEVLVRDFSIGGRDAAVYLDTYDDQVYGVRVQCADTTLWEQGVSTIHSGNGWVYMKETGETLYMIWVSPCQQAGTASYQYKVYEVCEKGYRVVEEKSYDVIYRSPYEETQSFPEDQVLEYARSLEEQLRGSTFLFACDTNGTCRQLDRAGYAYWNQLFPISDENAYRYMEENDSLEGKLAALLSYYGIGEKSIRGYEGYEGYLDACERWTEHEKYANLDYDLDGKRDRVYCAADSYRIEFGNGSVLQITGTENQRTPHFLADDITGDGVNEILYLENPDFSADPMAGGSQRLYEQMNGQYREVELPLPEEGIHWSFQDMGNQTIRIFCDDLDLDFQQKFEEERYEDLRENLKGLYQDGWSHGPYGARMVKVGDRNMLLCEFAVFDKGYMDTVYVMIGYRDGKYRIEHAYFRPEEEMEATGSPFFEMYADYDDAFVRLEIHEDTTAEITWNSQVLRLQGNGETEGTSSLYTDRNHLTLTVQDLNGDGEDDILIRRIAWRSMDLYVILHQETDGGTKLLELPPVPKCDPYLSDVWAEGNVDGVTLHVVFEGEEQVFALSKEYLSEMKITEIYFDEDGNLSDNVDWHIKWLADREQNVMEEDGIVYFTTKQHFLQITSTWTNVWVEMKFRLEGSGYALVDTSFGTENYNGW